MIPIPLKIIGWTLSIIVLATIVGTLMVIGSPAQARRESADMQRVNDLQSILPMVRNYRMEHHKLPDKLADCVSYPSNEGVLNDPGTEMPYEYRVLPNDRFELCATFETDTTKKPIERYESYGPNPEESFSRHPVGHVCWSFPGKAPPTKAP